MAASGYDSLAMDGRVAVVTGSASGIGRATAELLAKRGAAVVIADRDADGARKVARDLVGGGYSAIVVEVDVTEGQAVAAMASTVLDAFGRIDVLHNNAALMTAHDRDQRITELEAEDFARVLDVNLIGYTLCAKHVIPAMVAAGGGVIINTASLAGVLASLSRPMYAASKAAVVSLTRSIATQYGKQGIRALAVSPGMIVTERSVGRLPAHTLAGVRRHALLDRTGTPQDVAELVCFLASDAASFLTGLNIPLDGGLSAHLPTFADELDARG